MVVRRKARPKRPPSGERSGESEFEARLAPLEERTSRDDDDGRISVNTGNLKLPQELVEDDAAPEAARIDPVVLAIFFLALIFIIVVAFVIWNGWEPPQ